MNNTIGGRFIPSSLKGLQSTAAEIDGAVATVNGITGIHDYNIDFTTLTSTAAAGQTYFNNVPTTYAGSLSSITVKTPIGSTVTPCCYSIVDTGGGVYSLTLLHTYSSFVTTSLTQQVAISDSFQVPIGSFIGIKTTGNFYFDNNGKSFKVGSNAIQNARLAISFSITSTASSISDQISALGATVTSLNESKKLKKSILFSSYFSDLTSFSYVNWVANSNVASPAALGSGNYLWLNKQYNLDYINYSFNTTLYSDTVLSIVSAQVSYNQGNGVVRIDIPNSQIRVYDLTGSTETLNAQKTVSFGFSSGGKYKITLSKRDGWTCTATITNITTGAQDSITWNTSIASLGMQNRLQESIKLYQDAGASFIGLSSLSISSVYQPLVYLAGDSITEGVYFGTSDYSSRYAVQLKKALGGDCVISARGGATKSDITRKIMTEIPYIKPIYTMLTIGTNASFNSSELTTIINSIISAGSIPIINHVPNRADNSHIATNNTIDTVCNSTGAIVGALFDVCTSTGGNPANAYIATNYFDAGVHPNAKGQTDMFNRLKLDLPFLFD